MVVLMELIKYSQRCYKCSTCDSSRQKRPGDKGRTARRDVEGDKEVSVVLHGDAEAAAVDEELLDHVAPLHLVLVPSHDGRQFYQTVVQRPLD